MNTENTYRYKNTIHNKEYILVDKMHIMVLPLTHTYRYISVASS